MELFSVLLSGLLLAGSPINFIFDQVSTSILQDRLEKAEKLEVRIDNSPSHQILQGKIQKLRLASRGVYLTPALRIDTLELETDPLNVDLHQLKNRKIQDFRKILQDPIQTGVRLIITEEDINKAFQSEEIQTKIMKMVNRTLNKRFPNRRYDFSESKIDFLANNRLQF